MKKISLLLSAFILLTAFTCENEPLEGDFVTDEPNVACEQALMNTATAAQNFAALTEENYEEEYSEACSALKTAFENQLEACGDPDGSLQAAIDALGTCNLNASPCEIATSAVATAQQVLNQATEEEYADACNAYAFVLQQKINECGDEDGSIQDIIDGLDCETTNPEEPILINQIITTYEDSSILTDTFSYDGNKLISISDSDGYEITYEYENDLLTRINSYDPDGGFDYYLIPEYNSDEQLISYTVYVTSGNEGLRFDLTYNTNGTITEMKYSGNHTSQTSLIGEKIITMDNNQIISEVYNDGFVINNSYDNNNGMFKNIFNITTLNLINADFSGYITNGQNNLLTAVEDDNGVTSVYEEFEYNYNSNNYPETSTLYLEGALDATIQYIYQ